MTRSLSSSVFKPPNRMICGHLSTSKMNTSPHGIPSCINDNLPSAPRPMPSQSSETTICPSPALFIMALVTNLLSLVDEMIRIFDCVADAPGMERMIDVWFDIFLADFGQLPSHKRSNLLLRVFVVGSHPVTSRTFSLTILNVSGYLDKKVLNSLVLREPETHHVHEQRNSYLCCWRLNLLLKTFRICGGASLW